MPTFEVLPLVRVGTLSFGAHRGDVERIFGPATRSTPFNDAVGYSRSRYRDQSAFVDYDEDDRCAALEFHRPAVLMFRGQSLFELDVRELRDFLVGHGVSVRETGTGLTAEAIGLACYAPQLRDPDKNLAAIEGLLFARSGYPLP
ncbi:MAG: hypothetical protein HOW73_16835 [Polyangiaceae bacterium]|nr:hypothetical protein [Polyangiaceae bacterium]